MEDQNGRFRPSKGQRGSGASAFLFWVIALGAGGAAAYLINSYVETNAKATSVKLVKVAVAASNLDLATTIQAEHVQMQSWPESVVPPDAIRDLSTVVGRVLTNRLVKGQLILESVLASRGSGQGLAALIPPNMRAVAVAVDDVVGVAGFIHPEDRVDVIVTMAAARRDQEEVAAKVVLQNVTVLTVGKEIEVKDNSRNKPMSVTVATLLVSPEDSEKLALAANKGKLLLSLRGRADSERTNTPGMVASVLLGEARAEARSKPQPEPVAVVADAPVARRRVRSAPPERINELSNRTEKKQTVEILRGDRFEQRKFEVKENPL
jgi:pilus assembly protein CpaB